MEKNSEFYWQKALNFEDHNNGDKAFDESILYQEIRRKQAIKTSQIHQKHTLTLLYDSLISKLHYAEILTKYFNISEKYLAAHLVSLEDNGHLSWSKLATDITEVVTGEVQQYLQQKNILLKVITNRVEENVIKKSRRYFT